MRLRQGRVLGLACCAFVVCGFACVDLFHDTDFPTLCTTSPNDPACGGDGGTAADVTDSAVAVDARRPHPNFCAWSSTQARTEALRACAWLGACEGPLGESAFGPCVVHAQLAFDCNSNPSLRPSGVVDAFWGCLATVKSCADVDQCVFPDGVQACVEVPVGSSSACGTVGLNKGVRLKCAGPAGRAAAVEPCVMFGKTCTLEDPSTSSCSGTRGFNCTPPSCVGSALVDCTPAGTRSLDRGLDCAGYGAGTCGVGDAGAFCAPGTAALGCAADTPVGCDGTSVTTCVGGKEIRVACNTLGLPCDVSEPVGVFDPTAACVNRDAGKCDAPDNCVDGVMQSCGRGALYELKCESVGLRRCRLDTTNRASCAPP